MMAFEQGQERLKQQRIWDAPWESWFTFLIALIRWTINLWDKFSRGSLKLEHGVALVKSAQLILILYFEGNI